MLSGIEGKKFNSISRAIDMLCLFLGDDYTFIGVGGKRIAVAEIAIHFQSQWRFREGKEILLTAGDIYEPYSESVPEDWQYDLAGRADEQSSVFDVKAKALRAKMQGAVVAGCDLSAVNDIAIVFSNGVIFEQFVSSSGEEEAWRLIDYVNGEHFICGGEDENIPRQ